MRKDLTKPLSLFSSYGLVEGDDNPIHLSCGEVTAKISRQPKLNAGQICAAVISFVDLVGDVESAVMCAFAMLVVCCRVRIEIAHAEMRTAACFNRCRIDGPVQRSSVSGRNPQHSNY